MTMKHYTVYFELYGKKMKTTVQADSEAHARQIIRDKVVFHKVQEQRNMSLDDQFDNLMKIFGS